MTKAKENEKRRHYALSALARNAARGDYGVESLTEEAATKVIGDCSEGALLEIVRRINQAIKAWAADRDDDADCDDMQPPDDAAAFPDAMLGDTFYHGDFYVGFSPYVVVDKLPSGHIRLVRVGGHINDDGTMRVSWGDNDFYRTLVDAARAEVISDLAYHGASARRAEAVQKAIDAQLPFDHLFGEVSSKEETHAS